MYYMLNEDSDYLMQLFNSLDNSRAHDFMENLYCDCAIRTGSDEWFTIHARSAQEIAELDMDRDFIITREMIDNAYRTVTGGI